MANIEFPADDTESNEKSSFSFIDIVFGSIALLASGFSGYTTYLGFSYDFPFGLSLVVAIIIGLGLIGTNYLLRKYRLSGDKVGRIIIMFLFIFAISFISNTNAIYTYFLQTNIVSKTQTAAWETFDKGTTAILGAIEDNKVTIEGNRKKASLDIARRNLIDQITDVSNPGMGRKAVKHLEEIEGILGQNLTRLRPPRSQAAMQEFRDFAARYDQLILSVFNSGHNTSKKKKVTNLKDKITKLRTLYSSQVNDRKFSSDTTDLMARDLVSLNTEAQEITGFDEEIEMIDVDTDDIGSFQYTWPNFMKWINPAAIVLSVLISFILDTLAPMFSILLYRRELEY